MYHTTHEANHQAELSAKNAYNDDMALAIDRYYDGEITAEQLEEELESIAMHEMLMSQFWDIGTRHSARHTVHCVSHHNPHDFRRKYETSFIDCQLRTKPIPTNN